MKRLSYPRGYFRDEAACVANRKSLSIAGRLRAFLSSGGEGQSLVEFAFVVPILMALMMGIYAVGIITFNDVVLNNAVESGAMSLTSVGSSPGSNMAIAADYSTGIAPLADPCLYAFSQMSSASANLVANNITVTYVLNGAPPIGPFTGAAANTCASHSADFAAGGNFTIIATYPCTLGLYGFNIPGCKITATASQFLYTS